MDYLSGIAWDAALTVIVVGLCVVIEQFAKIEHFSLKSRIPGLVMNIAGTVLSAGLAWPLNKLWGALGVGSVVTVPLWTWLEPFGGMGYALQLLLLIMFTDFLIYWRHRAEHRWFWPIHAVHHSPTELHAANDIGHPTQVWINLVFVSIPLSLIRIDGPATPFVVGFVVSVLTYYIHSPIDVHFGPLRKLLVDNRFHRIHHSLEPRHFDKNFGIGFSIWDRMFGTAYFPEPDEWPDVGVAGVTPPRTLGDFLKMPATIVQSREKIAETMPAHDRQALNP